MKFAKRLLMAAGAVALAGLAGTMIAPKTAQALISTLVTVVNNVGVVNPTPSGTIQPIITTDADSLSRVPYQDSCIATNGIVSSPLLFCRPSPVPAGKRLVIEQVTAFCQAPTGKITGASVEAVIGSSDITHFLVLTPQDTVLGITGRVYTVSQFVRFYVDPGVDILFSYSSGDSAATCISTFSGYLEPTNIQ
jgi:hypothetical protein